MLLSRDSVLNSLSYFHVCDNQCHLISCMTFLRGNYLPYTLKLMLAQFIDSRYFKLSEVNTIISNLTMGCSLHMSQSNDQQERDVSVSHSGIYDLMLFGAQSALHEELCVCV